MPVPKKKSYDPPDVSQETISAPCWGFDPPLWQGVPGRPLYTESLFGGTTDTIFGDYNTEETIAFLNTVNNVTPIAGGLSGIIKLYGYGECRMTINKSTISIEDINNERVAQTESTIKGIIDAGFAIWDLFGYYKMGTENADSSAITNDIFKSYGIDNLNIDSVSHGIADFLTPKVSGNQTYTRFSAKVYSFNQDRLFGGYQYNEMDFTFDYGYTWRYAKVNLEEYYSN